jgi:hypothetical protein
MFYRIIYLFILSFPLLASPVLQDCLEHNESILKKSTFEDNESLKTNPDVHNIRFVRDEQKALEIMNKFSTKRLGLDFNYNQALAELENCSTVKHAQNFCENTFLTLNFFRGLSYGLTNYNWSKKTQDKGIKIFEDYIHESIKHKSTLISRIILISTLSEMSKAKLISKPTLKQIEQLQSHAESANQELTSELKKKKWTCEETIKIKLKEIQISQDLTNKIKKLI